MCGEGGNGFCVWEEREGVVSLFLCFCLLLLLLGRGHGLTGTCLLGCRFERCDIGVVESSVGYITGRWNAGTRGARGSS